MIALILAAGYGTRLYPLTKDKPKPLLPIQKRPLIDYLLDKVVNYADLKEVIVVTNDKFASHFEEWARSHKNFKVPITIVNDGTKTNDDRLGSIGDINFVIKQHHVQDDLLILGGDNLFDQNLDDFFKFCKQNSPRVSIGVFDIQSKEEAKKFGVLDVDEKKRINSFDEKPQDPKSTLIGMCLYYLPKSSLKFIEQYLNELKKSDTSGDYIRWLHEKEEVYCFTFSGTWYDIGSLEAYYEAEKSF